MSVTYTHTQISAQAVWQIAHNLNKYPSVTVVDSAGSVVVGDIRYIDRNNLTVTFTAGFAGKAVSYTHLDVYKRQIWSEWIHGC